MSEQGKLTSSGSPRKLWKSEYGWEAANPDGSTERGDLYVVDGVVHFLTDAEARASKDDERPAEADLSSGDLARGGDELYTQSGEAINAADDLLRRLDEWDVMNSTGDGPYFKCEIARVREGLALPDPEKEQGTDADMWENEANQGYEINGELKARLAAVEAERDELLPVVEAARDVCAKTKWASFVDTNRLRSALAALDGEQ